MARLADRLPQVLLAGLVVAVVLAMVFAASTSTSAFSAYNTGWDGASGVQSQAAAVGADSEVVVNTTAYASANPNQTVAVVLSPVSSYGPTERERIWRFVRQGGTLVVADQYGQQGNDLLTAVGANAQFDGRQLRDERNHYRSPALPVASNATATAVSTRGTTLTLNYGTAIRPNNATVAVTSSEFSYLDKGANERYDGETLDSYPVVTTERVGQGRVVAVSDPSIFINSMLDRPGNRAFVRNLFRPHETVLLDYSHRERPPPLAAAGMLVRQTPALQAGIGLLGLLAVLGWFRMPTFRRALPFGSDGGSDSGSGVDAPSPSTTDPRAQRDDDT